MFANDGCPQLNSPIINIFTELGETSNAKKMLWLKPDSQIAMLHATFKEFPIRHIPILDSKPGDLKALISRVDYAAIMTPPIDILPLGYLSPQEMKAVNNFIKEVASKPISEVFAKFFKGETEKLSATNSSLREAIEKLSNRQVDKKNNITRRYRTLPVFEDNKGLVGMLSYTNILKKIHENEGCRGFLSKRVKEIYKPAEDLTTLASDATMLQAAMQLDGALFTHIPITKADGSIIVTGVIDDLTIAKHQHPLVINAFQKLSLDEIKTWIEDENTVKETNTVGELIEKFLTITYPERPTAILVCSKNNNGEFVLQGIVSYTDILKGFVSWQEDKNHDRQE